MPRVTREEERLRAITSELRTVPLAPGAILPTLLPELRELLGADAACAYAVKVEGGRCEPEFILGDGLPGRFAELTHQYFDAAPIPWGFFDPSRPAPDQQNRVVMMSDLPLEPDKPLPPIAQHLFPKIGLANKDQVRVLLCEEGSLLAWVGAFRVDPFTAREKRMMEQLTVPLRDRLTLERRLAQGAVHAASLHAALEHLGSAAFILGPRGRIVDANSAGRVALEVHANMGELLASAVRGVPTDYTLTKISTPGLSDHHLAVRRTSRPDAKESATLASRRWKLTPRQTEVLALLAEGLSNRAISARLGCSESTVEIHVSAVLSKADVESRAALVARVWSQA